MKNLLIISTLLLCSFITNAQSVNGTPINEIDVEYVMIVGTSQMFSKKVTIDIDFGQNTKFFSSGKETQIKDAEGKDMKFNSMIDALNFMSSSGYEFVNAYAITMGGNQHVYHFVLRNKKHK